MKRFVEGETRTQMSLLPECLDDYVSENNPVRVVEAFIDALDLQQLVRYPSSEHGVRSFCGVCGSSLLFESEERAEQIDVVFANLDDPSGVRPTLHVYFDDRADWVQDDDDLPRLGGETGLEPLG